MWPPSRPNTGTSRDLHVKVPSPVQAAIRESHHAGRCHCCCAVLLLGRLLPALGCFACSTPHTGPATATQHHVAGWRSPPCEQQVEPTPAPTTLEKTIQPPHRHPAATQSHPVQDSLPHGPRAPNPAPSPQNTQPPTCGHINGLLWCQPVLCQWLQQTVQQLTQAGTNSHLVPVCDWLVGGLSANAHSTAHITRRQ